jgi:hypothetical protein
LGCDTIVFTYDMSCLFLLSHNNNKKGFPERFRMDYRSSYEDEVKAKFLGKALVRGYRSYLDVMQKNWRQYAPVSTCVITSVCVFVLIG